MRYNELPLIQGQTYVFEFDAYADANKPVDAKLERANSPYDNYGDIGTSTITRRKRHFSYQFTMQHSSDPQARIVFNCGKNTTDLYIDNVSLTQLYTSVESREVAPQQFRLHANYPNPFNGETILRYSLPTAGNVELGIYNVLGNKVRTVIQGEQNGGDMQASWDGRNHAGERVASGIYFYDLQFDDGQNKFKQTHKMMFIR